MIDEKNEIGEISEEVKKAYIDYAMSVIVSRALPTVEDGLKPVQRRILFTMLDMGLTPEKATKKTARIVGECLGKYHPHGDMAVYDALVRMAQDFSYRYPLIYGQGNFGSIDGDPPAAMRYTEAKLSPIAMEILEDIEKNTVDFVPNFDNTLKEPTVLPSKIPNLLINGSYGIAVGMATNILPHNLNEVVDGIISYIDNPNISIEELMKYIKGPDFPTGGIVYLKDLKQVYEKGKGKITIRGIIDTEEVKGKKLIVIKEIPYQINKSSLIQEIAKLIEDKIITDVINLKDESSKEGIRIVLSVKKEANEKLIINKLYKLTSLETSLNVINVALVNNVPKLLNLKELIKYWVDHRINVVRRRTNFLLNEAKNRKHILEGFSIALKNIEKIIEIIKKSENVNDAINKIMENFNLSKIQANAILDMKLSKLTKLEQEKINKEIKLLEEKIKNYEEILKNEKNILEVIKKELIEIKNKFGDKRRTKIEKSKEEIGELELIKKQDIVISLTYKGYINAVSLDEFNEQKKGGKGIIGSIVGEDDYINKILICSTHDSIIFITNRGNAYSLKAYNLALSSRYKKGKHISNIIQIKPEEKIKTIFLWKDEIEKNFLLIVTKKGVIKKIKCEELKNIKKSGIRIIKIPLDDEVIECKLIDKDKDIIIATQKGIIIRFNTSDVRVMKRNAYGIRAIKLVNDFVVDMCTTDKPYLLTVTDKGYGKKTEIEKYRKIKRGGKGIKNISLTNRNGFVIGVKDVSDDDSIILITKQGMIIRFKAKDIRAMGRVTQGVRLIKLKKDDAVIDVDVIGKL
ncbi:MAG: DNA gyrase subunit A [Candidatus Pacearchaeota archaeon]